ncbi:MAG: glucose-1-phosphate cytidylyltransferase [Halopseudomonas aestusnigri]
MKAVILAGGLGSRISEETHLKPKPMVEVGGMPILWHIMKIYSSHGINDFIICLGYKGYVIKEYFANYFLHNADVTIDLAKNQLEYHASKAESWKITLVDTGSSTQTGGRVKRVAPYLNANEPFCLTYGDGVGNVNVRESIEAHKKAGRKATMTVVTPPGRFGAAIIEGDGVSAFAEKPQGERGRINAGYFVCEPSVIDLIDGDATIWEKEPLTQLAESGELTAFSHQDFWQPMDTLREKNELEAMWASGKAPWKTW